MNYGHVFHLKVFGCITFALIPIENRKKLDYKFEIFIFLGYSDESKGYKLMKKANRSVLIS
jgi:hypothetical protein